MLRVVGTLGELFPRPLRGGAPVAPVPSRSVGGFHQWGYPNSWLVFVRENATKMDENWGYPYFRKPSYRVKFPLT